MDNNAYDNHPEEQPYFVDMVDCVKSSTHIGQKVPEIMTMETNSFLWVSENILSKLSEVAELYEGSPRTASAFEGLMMDRVVTHDTDQMD